MLIAPVSLNLFYHLRMRSVSFRSMSLIAVASLIAATAINARSDVQAQTIEGQRQSFNNPYGVGSTRQTTGNAHLDDIHAGSEDMQNYILDRGWCKVRPRGATEPYPTALRTNW